MKILFLVATHGNEQAPMQLFYEFPYGKNDYCQWEVMVVNPQAVLLNQRYVYEDMNRKTSFLLDDKYSEHWRKQFILQKIKAGNYDVVYDVHTNDDIHPDTWPDCGFVNKMNDANKQAVSYLETSYIIWDHNPLYNQYFMTSGHPVGITLEYQKTGDVWQDRERIKSDFFRITMGIQRENNKSFYKADIPVTQDQKDKLHLQFQDFKPLTLEEKMKLSLSDLKKEWIPVFCNTREISPENYCYLNKKIT